MKLYFNATWIGLLIQIYSIGCAYGERGKFAVGGEWLIMLLTLMIVFIIREIRKYKEEDNVQK